MNLVSAKKEELVIGKMNLMNTQSKVETKLKDDSVNAPVMSSANGEDGVVNGVIS